MNFENVLIITLIQHAVGMPKDLQLQLRLIKMRKKKPKSNSKKKGRKRRFNLVEKI